MLGIHASKPPSARGARLRNRSRVGEYEEEEKLTPPAVALLLCLACLLPAGCDREEPNAGGSRPRVDQELLVDFADEHFPAQALASAVPAGFELLDVKRDGYERHGKEWVTVSVRMKGPVPFARAIFYIHSDSNSAESMFERQSRLGIRQHVPGNRAALTQSWSEEALTIPNGCHVRAELYWCHAYSGKVYLVTQSTAGSGAGRQTSRLERRMAAALLSAFATYLEKELVES